MLAQDTAPLTWNLVRDVTRLLEFHFMVNAFRAGTAVAVTAAVVGWFMVVREQVFAGHTLSLVGFSGAAGAVWLGLSAAAGFFAVCIGAALVVAAVPRTRGPGYGTESALVGTVQAVTLAAGFLFVSLYGGFLNGITALLFGTMLGITDGQVVALCVVALACLAVLAAVARPLLLASIDPDVAAARGLPPRLLSAVFLVVLGAAVAQAAEITGALLVFALLVVPAASAQALTPRPGRSLLLAVALALAVTWSGLAAAYFSPYPVGFWVSTIAFAVYVAARATVYLRARRDRAVARP